MKKMLCLLLCALLLPLGVLAEDSAAAALSYQELVAWAEEYIDRAMTAEPLNDPAASFTADGYEFIYDFATLYADSPILSADSSISAVVITTEENTPRGVAIGSGMTAVLEAYYSENPDLTGSYESAVLYAVDTLPEAAQWGKVNRDGQRVQTIQYAVHEQLATGGEGYTNAGVIYTMAENRVSAVRVYGLDSRITLDEVNDVMYSVMLDSLRDEYAQVPFSYNGAELTVFAQEDMVFSGMDFLALTAEDAVKLLGQPVDDTWVDNGADGYIRVMTFADCELTFLYDPQKTQGRVYMLLISADGLEGPRAVRCGDTFSSVYNRFRFGEGKYQEDDTEVLYGVENQGSFGHAAYGISDASATLRYGFTAQDGRRVVLQMSFTVMELTEIMLYAE